MDRKELRKLYNRPENLRLKRIALCVAGGVIAIMLTAIVLIRQNCISWQVLALLRGIAGLGALAFIGIVGVFVYRVNDAYIKQRGRRNRPH